MANKTYPNIGTGLPSAGLFLPHDALNDLFYVLLLSPGIVIVALTEAPGPTALPILVLSLLQVEEEVQDAAKDLADRVRLLHGGDRDGGREVPLAAERGHVVFGNDSQVCCNVSD